MCDDLCFLSLSLGIRVVMYVCSKCRAVSVTCCSGHIVCSSLRCSRFYVVCSRYSLGSSHSLYVRLSLPLACMWRVVIYVCTPKHTLHPCPVSFALPATHHAVNTSLGIPHSRVARCYSFNASPQELHSTLEFVHTKPDLQKVQSVQLCVCTMHVVLLPEVHRIFLPHKLWAKTRPQSQQGKKIKRERGRERRKKTSLSLQHDDICAAPASTRTLASPASRDGPDGECGLGESSFPIALLPMHYRCELFTLSGPSTVCVKLLIQA